MVVVGLASFGVNRFLARTQQRVLSESIAIIEQTERVTQDADFAASLAGQLAATRDAAPVPGIAQTLDQRVDRIAADLQAMRAFLGRAPDPGPEQAVRGLADRMTLAVGTLIAAKTAMLAERGALADAGARIAELIATERDLARLRITAGIWDLYALPPGADPRPGLDRLADGNFFAYERLAEMAQAVAALDRLALRIVEVPAVDALAGPEADFAAALALARDRARFMLSISSRQAAGAQVQRLATALAPNGLVAQRRAGIAAQAQLDALAGELDRQLDLLIEEARLGREETRARMQDGVAAAAWQATMLSAALATVILLALLLAYLLWSRTRRRVVLRLEDVAERMIAVADGDMGQPLAISGQDEIGRLEAALNILRDRAEEALRLRGSLEAAVIDRTAEVVAEMRSANAARADAEEQGRSKMHFLARMSHEIRTPLNGLIGLLDLVALDETDATRRARLQVALTSARDLQALTEDILAFSVGQDDRAEVRRAAFDPAALARGLGAHLEVIAAQKGLRAVIEIADRLPAALMGEPTRIRQVMMNLLSNAVKYTDRGQVTLTVTARPAGAGQHDLSLTVRDTGPGMTEDETRHAFDIYGRSQTARRSGVGGVGLGLAIVRQLTDAMGAELRVSTAPGRGSSFALALRLPEAPEAGTEASPDRLAGAGLRVLVVDDHPVNRLVARGYLGRLGCTVTEAETGQAALQAARAGQFDVILLDLGLPDIAGEEVAARIDRKGAQLAILTADLQRDDADTRHRLGADRILTKPISPRELAAFLSEGGTGAKAPPPGPAVDAALAEDIDSLGAGQTAAILRALLDDMTAAVPQLRAETDPVARRKLAHRLKGAAANFRLDGFCALMQRIQSGDLSALDSLDQVAAGAVRDLVAAAQRAGLPVQPGEGAGAGAGAGAAKQ